MGKTVKIHGFPTNVSDEDVKVYLEKYTGEETVVQLKIGQPRKKGSHPRAFAIVQFTTAECVETISNLIKGKLYYGTSYLKILDVKRDIVDIVSTTKASMLNMEVTNMHFGNQVSKEKFLVLWTGSSVAVNFSVDLRKMEFLLSHCCREYKLEFSYNGIWQIQLRRPQNRRQKFLLIQISMAPLIYDKPLVTLPISTEGPSTYFKDAKGEWVRTTDFTEKSCIGQSFAICLELPRNYDLRGIREEFYYYYTENEGNFYVERGSTFSHSLDLVPIVEPPQQLDLPHDILFKINNLMQCGCLAGPTLDASFYRLVHPQFVPIAHIEHALNKLYSLKECCYEPAKWLDEQYKIYHNSKHFAKPAVCSNDGVVSVHRIEITPSRVYFCNPDVIVSNRVLRNYQELLDNFLRVSFVDEDGNKMWSADLSPRTLPSESKRHTNLYLRILSVLRNGIVIGNKNFEFLAYSSSQLRENSLWMFAPGNGVTAAIIREWMGDFCSIRNVAKYAARLGQSFSSSRKSVTVYCEEMEIIPDIKVERDGVEYIFSDGIGKISLEFARTVARKCGLKGLTPSAFQIRYAGFKGVVAVDPKSITKLSLRKSMQKYESKNTELDVLNWSKSLPCYLNRQVIALLSTLGVRDEIFEKKQREVVSRLDTILTDSRRALEALEIMSPGENLNVLREMLKAGYKPDEEPYLSMMLQTFRKAKLLDLRKKSRIFIHEGRALMGCLDETRSLEYGEVFIQVSCRGGEQDPYNAFHRVRSNKRTFIVEGKVVVAKNPCLHPGDVRVLRAVNDPRLLHMVNCIVFPQKGIRPHPHECSGSDLDGDMYFVCWDPELIPDRQTEPMDYTPAPAAILDHDVTIEEVQEYFVNYMLNDSLGMIANAHIVHADKEASMAESDACLELAKLFSIAVDFPKTGVPAEIPSRLQVKEFPDFMEKLDRLSYESTRVIGKLFREVKDIEPQCITSFTREVAMRCYDRDMEVDGFEYYLDDAYHYKEKYDLKLGKLMDCHGVKSEGELLARGLVNESVYFNRKQDLDSRAVMTLRKEVRTWFYDKGSNSGAEEGTLYAKASAWYHVTYHPNYYGRLSHGRKWDHFLSFPWCVYDKLIHIKRENKKKKTQDQPLKKKFPFRVWLS